MSLRIREYICDGCGETINLEGPWVRVSAQLMERNYPRQEKPSSLTGHSHQTAECVGKASAAVFAKYQGLPV